MRKIIIPEIMVVIFSVGISQTPKNAVNGPIRIISNNGE